MKKKALAKVLTRVLQGAELSFDKATRRWICEVPGALYSPGVDITPAEAARELIDEVMSIHSPYKPRG